MDSERLEKILLVEPDPGLLGQFQLSLAEGCECLTATTVAGAQRVLRQEPVRGLFVAENLPDGNGMDFIRALWRRNPKIKMVLMTARADPALLLAAINEGCLFRCLLQPVAPEELCKTVREALRSYQIERVQENLALHAAEIDRQLHSVPYWVYRVQTIFRHGGRILAVSVLGVLTVALLVLLLGIGILVLLYFLKSLAGIDILEQSHLNDFIPLQGS